MPPLTPLALKMRETIRRGPVAWASACHIALRPYQRQIALAIKTSIIHNLGLTFVVVLPRQSGKNELQSHLFSWLLFRYAKAGGRIVSVSPTFKPQTTNNMDRVKVSLDACVGSRGLWKSSKGYLYCLGNARLQFFSGEPRAKVVGATADLLLSVDEAQSVSPAKYDKDFSPMTASTNATRVFWGTAWTSDTLLERQRRLAMQAQQKDGIQRVFFYTADDVRRLVPAYGLHVDGIIAELGRNNPLVRTQYFSESIDAQSDMFNPARLALIQSDRPPLESPSPFRSPEMGRAGEGSGEGSGVGSDSPLPKSEVFGDRVASRSAAEGELEVGRGAGPGTGPDSPPPFLGLKMGEAGGGCIAFLIDIAGQDESKMNVLQSFDVGLGNPGRDSTALSIVEIDLSTLETLQRPTYHVVARHSWVGENHLAVFGKLKNLAETWNPQHIVMDATGVGEGLWALMDRAFPARVIPVKFTQQEKSELGWRFLSIIETGRFRDHVHTDEVRLQYNKCICEILPGPAKTLRWGVPDGTRGPDGELIHDDFIIADSLTAILDRLEWYIHLDPSSSEGWDPLEEMDLNS